MDVLTEWRGAIRINALHRPASRNAVDKRNAIVALCEQAKGAEEILSREGFAGAARFAAGAGRHGSFADFAQEAK
jgi:hypothetical protein